MPREGDITNEAETENQRSHAACLADGGAQRPKVRGSTSWKRQGEMDLDGSFRKVSRTNSFFFFLTLILYSFNPIYLKYILTQ